jgi:undecaprenyl diphosphate synthase
LVTNGLTPYWISPVSPSQFTRRLLVGSWTSPLPLVAIIMDVTGAEEDANLPRVEYRAGVQAVKDTVEAAGLLEAAGANPRLLDPRTGSAREVWTLVNLRIHPAGARHPGRDVHLEVVGRWRELDASVVSCQAPSRPRQAAGHAPQHRPQHSGAADRRRTRAYRHRLGGGQTSDIDEETLGRYLYGRRPTRSAGRVRRVRSTSGVAYSEIWVTNTLWPDFRRRELFEAILDFQRRERRYGGVSPDEAVLAPQAQQR